MSYGTLLVSLAPTVIKVMLEYIKELKKKEDSIVAIKEIKADPMINELLGKSGDQPAKIMVEVRLDAQGNNLDHIKQEITESGRVLGIETIDPYKYVEKKK
jgi:hypothetical protein